ncbi:MAG: caspase family protein [Salinivirgaceae bacterium]|nr:caspase family protein [Salinivirgaceae bacterium]MDD4747862.1 caspase family protein [Salinivirgaceae bacterium]MDY0279883.1 caspase family protein [Salinivirgaceae bacterium]
MMIKKSFPYILLLVIALTISSCATLIYGVKQSVAIQSDPPGANVFINGKDQNKTTPCIVKIKRRQPRNENFDREITYELKKEDYNSVEIKDEGRKNYFVAIASWSLYLVPGMIDLITQANNQYKKEHSAKLYPIGKTIFKTDTVFKREIVYVNKDPNTPKYIFEGKSDIDRNIPQNKEVKSRRFALIIGNEDYKSQQLDLSTETDVKFARNDASAFKEYAQKTMGIPERNIIFLLDATMGQMRQAITKINAIIKSTYGEAEVFVYYAGHGLPDELNKEPHLIPVDVSGKNVDDGIKLTDLYAKLTEYPAKRVTVFIDACFSGGARNQGLLSARAVRVTPKKDNLGGNLVVFTASSGDQSSLPYDDQEHGIFTYYLLKCMKENGPNVNYMTIMNYLKQNVELESVLVNSKEQTPQVNHSSSIDKEWINWTLE